MSLLDLILKKKRPSTLGGRPDKDHRAEGSFMFPARSKLEIKIAFRKRSNKHPTISNDVLFECSVCSINSATVVQCYKMHRKELWISVFLRSEPTVLTKPGGVQTEELLFLLTYWRFFNSWDLFRLKVTSVGSEKKEKKKKSMLQPLEMMSLIQTCSPLWILQAARVEKQKRVRADSENHRTNKEKMAERQRERGGWTRIGGVLISAREAIWSRLKAPKPLQVQTFQITLKRC